MAVSDPVPARVDAVGKAGLLAIRAASGRLPRRSGGC